MIGIVVPSRTHELLNTLLGSIRRSEGVFPLVVVGDNGLHLQHVEAFGSFLIVPIPDPFCFANAINTCVAILPSNLDILVLNDDTKILTEGFLEKCKFALASFPSFGILSPIIAGGCGNPDQTGAVPAGTVLETSKTICFVASLIRRTAWDQVGHLDERFVGYGWDDDDYCLRVKKMGWKTGVFGEVVVEHGGMGRTMSTTYHRIFTREQQVENSKMNRRVFLKKWGFLPDERHHIGLDE